MLYCLDPSWPSRTMVQAGNNKEPVLFGQEQISLIFARFFDGRPGLSHGLLAANHPDSDTMCPFTSARYLLRSLWRVSETRPGGIHAS
jgi:hypothetical protein